jgi:short-subunit dehydrogenase
MKNLRGRTAILTGASGGIGRYIAPALAKAGMNLVLVAFPGLGLDEVCSAATKEGAKVLALDIDLRDSGQRRQVVSAALKQFGEVDVLVNNAAVEFCCAYHELSETNIKDVLSVNLEAPMMLTYLVLPEMLRRGRGHIVNISSFAGRLGPGFQEPYSATKAGLTAFTYSLRGTYRRTGVSASVVCPGFVEAGVYSRLKAKVGHPAPGLFGASVCSPERVVRAVVRVIRHDLPEVFVNRYPVRPALALYALSPSLGEWITDKILGAHDFFRAAAEARKGTQAD